MDVHARPNNPFPMKVRYLQALVPLNAMVRTAPKWVFVEKFKVVVLANQGLLFIQQIMLQRS
jgi:hypothetical protein